MIRVCSGELTTQESEAIEKNNVMPLLACLNIHVVLLKGKADEGKKQRKYAGEFGILEKSKPAVHRYAC